MKQHNKPKLSMVQPFGNPAQLKKSLQSGMNKLNGKVSHTLKAWFKKASDFTIEESKVLSIRAQEAGHLAKLNAKRYQLNADFQTICAEIGQQVLGLSEMGKESQLSQTPKVKELITKASHIEKKLKQMDSDIGHYKKECDQKVKQIHRDAA